MAAKGVVKGNVVVLEEGASLPEGTPVVVSPLTPSVSKPLTLPERMAILERMFAMNLPVADWPQMEKEILEGAYGQCLP